MALHRSHITHGNLGHSLLQYVHEELSTIYRICWPLFLSLLAEYSFLLCACLFFFFLLGE